MKFIPLQSFEQINSLLQEVEAQGCLVTLQLEAFTCRQTKEERQVATTIANRLSYTPPISPQPRKTAGSDFDDIPVPFDLGKSAPLVSTAASSADAGSFNALTSSFGPLSTPIVAPEDVDERLVYLVAALNNIYVDEDYDFTVLTEQDFSYEEEDCARNEINHMLQSLPEQCSPAVFNFWGAVEEQVLDAARGCEYFQLRSQEYNPRANRTIFCSHYFLYNKRRKALVSIIMYGTGNMYRGDDGCEQELWGDDLKRPYEYRHYDEDGDEASTRHYASSPELMDEAADAGGSQKNKDFYGFY